MDLKEPHGLMKKEILPVGKNLCFAAVFHP
jgi:hypothetical protein